MLLTRDILRLLVKRNPDIANVLLRSNRTIHRWIREDKGLMLGLARYYRDNIYKKLNAEVVRLFHLCLIRLMGVMGGPGLPDKVINVHLSETFKGKEYKVMTESGRTHTGTIKQLRTEMTNPQSRDAYRQITRLHKQSRSLPAIPPDEDRDDNERDVTQMIDDICNGVKWVCRVEHKPKSKFTWMRLAVLFLMCEIAVVLAYATKGVKGGFAICFGLLAFLCYVVCEKNLI
jgi:hypothetical protein